MQCANCASDYYYDSNTHTCVKKPEYIPNTDNNNWIVSSDAGLAKVGALLVERSAIKGSAKCSDEKPHFNNITKACEGCAKGTFWNYETNTCMSCGPG